MVSQSMGSRNVRCILSVLMVLTLISVIFISSTLATEIVTNDYFINHQSIEKVYGAQKLDPTVLIHVREVVLRGRERTAPAEGKVLLLAHGAATAGYIGFDGGCENCSMMRYFAQAGWDVFTLDYENFGMSSCSPVFENPTKYPESEMPTTTEVAVNDLERVIEFISSLRGAKKVSLFGWSFGAIKSAPNYTIRHPEKVDKLVLFAGVYEGSNEQQLKQGEMFKKLKVLPLMPSYDGWNSFGTKPENLRPGALEWYRDTILATDPKSGELGGKYRIPAGPLADIYLTSTAQFDASKITAPTLVIRGANDIAGTAEGDKKLIERLASKVKKAVVIPVGGHYLFFEKSNMEFFKAIKDFLEAKMK